MINIRSFVPLSGLAAGLLAGWVAFPMLLYKSIPQPVQFSHATHTSEAVGMACEACHVLGDDGRFAGIPSVQLCAGCHAEPVGDTDNERRFVEEYVKQNREIPWKVYARQPDNAHFPHVQHVKQAGLACVRCHGPHGTSTALRPYEENRISGYSRAVWGPSIARINDNEWEGMKMDDCISCHRERQLNRSCIDCHK